MPHININEGQDAIQTAASQGRAIRSGPLSKSFLLFCILLISTLSTRTVWASPVQDPPSRFTHQLPQAIQIRLQEQILPDAQDPLTWTEPHHKLSLSGPVIPFNFPDPAVLHIDGITYAYATNNRLEHSPDLIHVQVAHSRDNQTWYLQANYDVLPDVGEWALTHGIWAPDVVRLVDGTFIIYYAAQSRERAGTHCVGAATSPSALGPYHPLSTPIACPISLGGAIDPDGFLDPSTNRRYITYKVDGNNIGHGGSCRNGIPPLIPTPILLQEVSPINGYTPIGPPIPVLDRIDSDGPLIEAPALYRSRQGIYFLFYSSNCFTTPYYDVKYATATDIEGPYVRAEESLLTSGDGGEDLGILGPGGMDVLTETADASILGGEAEEAMVLFHGILREHQMPDGYEVAYDLPRRPTGLIRGMYQGRIRFEGRRAFIV